MDVKVVLLKYTPDPERTVAAAAKLCYSESGAASLEEDLSREEVERFLKILIKMGHLSPIEHAGFTFAIEGVSRVLTHQLVRHRLASYSQQSQRYITESNFEFIVPPSIKGSQRAFEKYTEIMENVQKNYDELHGLLKDQFTKQFLNEGVEQSKAAAAADKLANEDARFILPNATETKIVMTMNARELLHFFNQRCCNRAQWEIRELAYQMVKLVKPVAPIIFANAGPRCLEGVCPEGAMSCRKQEEVKMKYAALQ